MIGAGIVLRYHERFYWDETGFPRRPIIRGWNDHQVSCVLVVNLE